MHHIRALGKVGERAVLGPDKVAYDVGRANLETDVAVVGYRLDPGLLVYLQVRGDELSLHLTFRLGVQQSDLQEIVVSQRVGIDSQLLGNQACGGDAAAFAVAPVVHLDGRFKDVAPANGHAGGETDDAAAALFGDLVLVAGQALCESPSGSQDLLCKISHDSLPPSFLYALS